MARKRKTLPRDFEDRLKTADLAELKTVFDVCELDARAGHDKRCALAFDDCPDELARWLVASGADLQARSEWGETPLHSRAGSPAGRIDVLLELGADLGALAPSRGTPLHMAASAGALKNVERLLKAGAAVDAPDGEGRAPLESALRRCSNIDIERVEPVARRLLEAGAARTAAAREAVLAIGRNFEFHRAAFNPLYLAATDAALKRLYALFELEPVAPRHSHQGEERITLQARDARAAFEEAWELLVPSQGAAATAQGEAIRIAGRLAQEWEANGGANWDADFARMADAFPDLLTLGRSLAGDELAYVRKLVDEVKKGEGDAAALARFAVAWVRANPTPIPIGRRTYKR
jgi:hypothetical protein